MTFESTWRDLAGFVVMAGCMTALAARVVPGVSRPSPVQWCVTLFAGIVVLVVYNESGLLRFVHEDVFNRVGGEFDEQSTWLVALAGALVAVAVCRGALWFWSRGDSGGAEVTNRA